MAKAPDMAEILKLSVEERLQLISEIWDSIVDEDPDLPLSPELQEELDRRLAEADANPGEGASWEEVKARLMNRLS